MSYEDVERVEEACRRLLASGKPVTFTAVAQSAGIGRATLYRREELRAVVEEHRARAHEALTLSGLAVEVDQLRTAVDAVASKVRRHEELLRRVDQKNHRKRPRRKARGN
jgi:hypothetical protein